MRAGNLQDTAMQVSLSIYLPIRYANVGYLTSPLLECEYRVWFDSHVSI